MFESEASIKNIKELQSVLGTNIIRKLLLSRNNLDELPLNNAFLTNGIEIIEWILNQFDDPLEKYYLIAKRNKFNKTLLDKSTRNTSLFEITTGFMAKIISECLDALDLNNLDMTIIKDTFQSTIC